MQTIYYLLRNEQGGQEETEMLDVYTQVARSSPMTWIPEILIRIPLQQEQGCDKTHVHRHNLHSPSTSTDHPPFRWTVENVLVLEHRWTQQAPTVQVFVSISW